MPPKPKFTKEEIVNAALGIVSERGADALTAKELGNALGSSARPIFTIFNTMKEVQEEVHKAAMERFEGYAETIFPEEMPLFKRMGMKMVLFGVQEPKLYQLLFMQENENVVTFHDMYAILGNTTNRCIQALQEDYSLNVQQAEKLFENMWIYTFGVGALCATGVCHFSKERLSEMLSTEFQALMGLIKA